MFCQQSRAGWSAEELVWRLDFSAFLLATAPASNIGTHVVLTAQYLQGQTVRGCAPRCTHNSDRCRTPEVLESLSGCKQLLLGGLSLPQRLQVPGIPRLSPAMLARSALFKVTHHAAWYEYCRRCTVGLSDSIMRVAIGLPSCQVGERDVWLYDDP
ncbi:hypothetical protein BD311DRAFT_377149 [Dichomitus squalens]|uniref:Uncharacterized protein n=1 Tax=Dichomitus squalens TaxID=114155 RepID=A0A4Q9MKK4_9APHY|nr:hypothetical protein BD311DRAFT_377149 [Dichomitus squalens]